MLRGGLFKACVVGLMFVVGAASGYSVYSLLFGQAREIQSRNITETVRLLEQGLKSFDIVAIENVSRVLFGSSYVAALKVVTGSGFVVFDERKPSGGLVHTYQFTDRRDNGDVRRVGTVVVEVDHDPNSTRNITISCLTGGLLSFLLVRLVLSARSLRRELIVREASENALREQEENLRILLNSLTEAVIATDSEGRVNQMNPVAEYLTGWPLVEAAGQSIDSVVHIVDSKSRMRLQVLGRLSRMERDPFAASKSATLLTRFGAEYRVSHSAAPMMAGKNRVAGAVVVFRDVTAEMQVQQTIREMEKMQAIGVLAGGVAHDFNNLLAIISSAAEVISLKEQATLTPSTARLLETITKTTRRGADLTSRLLAVGRKLSGEARPLSLHASIDNVVAILRRTIDKKFDIGVELKAKNDRVQGDVSAIENVLLNIGLNASQAMKADGGTFVVTTENVDIAACDDAVRTHHALVGPCIKIILRDAGVGIPAENLTRIFEPFFTNRRGGGGFGLGLWMVYNTVRDHGGTIHVESQVGVETSFVIHLPTCSEPVSASMSRTQLSKPKNKTILVVDDEDEMRSMLSEMLVELGCQPRLASSGEEAIRSFRQGRGSIDAIMMDLNMPGMSGDDALSEVLRIDPAIPIVISSGYSATRQNAARKDVDKCLFLPKPYSLSDLDATLTQLFEEHARGGE